MYRESVTAMRHFWNSSKGICFHSKRVSLNIKETLFNCLIHDHGADRTDGAAVAAGEAFALIHLSKAIVIIEDGTGRAGGFAGTTAFAVFMIDINLFS